MSTPLLFIIFPFILAVVLYFFQTRKRLVYLLGITTCLVLMLFAYLQNFGAVWKIGPVSIEIKTSLAILGRSFSLTNQDKFFLTFLYFACAVWFGGTRSIQTGSRFIPFGLAIVSILTAALAVEPFLYSAILVEIAMLASIPLLVEPGKPAGSGVLRYIVYQSMAMPFILFGGWLLGGIQASPSDATRLLQSVVFLGVGFAIWLAIVPFQSWVPKLSEELNPYVSGFLLGLFPIVTMLIMIDFISGLVWLRESAYLEPALRLVGAIMVISTGVWAIIEMDLRRLLGYSVLLESGLAVLLVSLQSETGVSLLLLSFFPRIAAMAIMALSLTIIKNNGVSLHLEAMSGLIKKMPVASLSLVFSLFAIAGGPLLAGFPVRLSMLELLAERSPSITLGVLVGLGFFLFAVMRLLFRLTKPIEANYQRQESNVQIAMLVLGILFLVVFGFFPNLFVGIFKPLFMNLPILR